METEGKTPQAQEWKVRRVGAVTFAISKPKRKAQKTRRRGSRIGVGRAERRFEKTPGLTKEESIPPLSSIAEGRLTVRGPD